ncbi:hypothetical protein FB45DRAFT_261035 [Roridomyces roridus]|uniref:Uncharacterized protein n=1 Tax=Roridomyces roridus TaxID=1738132 RepID=A0AAD7B9B1_9AGAR|nr:hypothetical protein FB45DRAFT_261035 [Roridomyces roridus]
MSATAATICSCFPSHPSPPPRHVKWRCFASLAKRPPRSSSDLKTSLSLLPPPSPLTRGGRRLSLWSLPSWTQTSSRRHSRHRWHRCKRPPTPSPSSATRGPTNIVDDSLGLTLRHPPSLLATPSSILGPLIGPTSMTTTHDPTPSNTRSSVVDIPRFQARLILKKDLGQDISSSPLRGRCTPGVSHGAHLRFAEHAAHGSVTLKRCMYSRGHHCLSGRRACCTQLMRYPSRRS